MEAIAQLERAVKVIFCSLMSNRPMRNGYPLVKDRLWVRVPLASLIGGPKVEDYHWLL